MYGLIGLMGEKYGAPYNTFPFSCMEFGKSSTGGSGGTCGSLMGAAQAISLFFPRKIAIPMQTELFRWFELTAFPIFQPEDGVGKVDGPFETVESNSILCHVSVAKWCGKTGYGADSKHRSERCSRLTADVARKTAELIFAQMDGTFNKAYGYSDLQKSCREEGCHGGDDNFAMSNLKGKMDCQPCHTGIDAVMDKSKGHY